MKGTLRFLALAVLLVALATWLVTGANRGWTKNRVPITTPDAVTGLEGITYQDRFVPGVDFLGAALLGAAFLAGVSLLFRPQPKTKP